MNIVHFSGGRINPNAAKVGSVNIIYHVAKEQSRLGHQVKVFVLPEKKDYENIDNEGFEILEYSLGKLKGFLLSKNFKKAIYKEQKEIDISHFHCIYSPSMIRISLLMRKFGIPYVVSPHGSFSPFVLKKHDRIKKFIFENLFVRRYISNASLIHFSSKEEFRIAENRGILEKSVFVENGFDLSSFPKTGIDKKFLDKKFPNSKGSLRLLFFGRLDPWHKGIDLLFYALKKAVEEKVKFYLFIAGPEKRRYRGYLPKLAKKLGISKRVIFLGPVFDPVKKFSLICSSNLFVLTSRFEGFPLTLFEALACETPILVTPGTNAGGLVKEYKVGFLCDPNPDSIFNSIKIAWEKRNELKIMGKRGLAVIEKYNWRKTANGLIKGYQRVLY